MNGVKLHQINLKDSHFGSVGSQRICSIHTSDEKRIRDGAPPKFWSEVYYTTRSPEHLPCSGDPFIWVNELDRVTDAIAGLYDRSLNKLARIVYHDDDIDWAALSDVDLFMKKRELTFHITMPGGNGMFVGVCYGGATNYVLLENSVSPWATLTEYLTRIH